MNDLDLILPVYNPSKNWAEVIVESINKIKELRPELKISVIVINDGSDKNVSDEQMQYLSKNIERFVYHNHRKNHGKGAAIRSGLEFCSSRVIIYTDADFPYAEEYIPMMYDKVINEKCNIVIAVRDDQYDRSATASRKFLSTLIQRMNKILLNLPHADSQAGLKAFDQMGAGLLAETRIDGFLFDLEMLVLAGNTSEINVGKFPVKLKDSVVLSKFKTSLLIKELLNYMKIVFRVWISK
ncbi:MAG: glycosyltransferase family 2 protein [Chitinophagales bacterium]|nr:glycosyltransferase family 2 protein [Chitinophagales bacterium]